ncbi:Wzy polymerase domain-containing protein [Acinetobacter sp. WZC-1]|uniref:Wzy polymerase domain-containing protein n=1 Tax=Acinetobacter sp. WZC-1 TaxID=3459034 RepID=UPI00403D9902
MKAIPYILSAILLLLAWLLPIHKIPWTTFGSEILTFLAGLALLTAFFKQPLKIAKPQLMAGLFLLIPLVQWLFGQVLYFSNALLCTAYILMFWLMVAAGYNLALENGRENVLRLFSGLLIVVAVASSLIAILQWLQFSTYFFPYMDLFKGNRPYANFAQPNNLATFLTMGLLGCLYFYEKRIASNLILIPVSLVLIFSIALTQSRTSWVVCLFILIYLGIQQFKQPRLFSFIKLLSWVAVFVFMISVLPVLNDWIELFLQQQVAETATVVERASSGYLRLDMWSQTLIAITERPWLGYGWNQTGMAQIAAFDLYPSHEWYKSAHNLVLDLLVWNGIPLAALILLYLASWLFWLNRGIKDAESLVATLMVCAILIHAMLEYPVHYAYFLLPMGFLLGLIQAQYPRLPAINFNTLLLQCLLVLGLILTAVVYRDYGLYKQQSVLITSKMPLNASQQKIMDQNILVLTQFRERVWWIGLDPKTRMSDQQLAYIARMVANMASEYDLYKYAQLLAFNGQRAEAEHQLWILKQLHGEEHHYQELLMDDAK